MGCKSSGFMKALPLCLSAVLPGEMGLLLAQHLTARRCGPLSPAERVLIFLHQRLVSCWSNSARLSSKWLPEAQDTEVTPACRIHLTPSPWNSFAEKEKHDSYVVNNFLKGKKDIEIFALCEMREQKDCFQQVYVYKPISWVPVTCQQVDVTMTIAKTLAVLLSSYWLFGKFKK